MYLCYSCSVKSLDTENDRVNAITSRNRRKLLTFFFLIVTSLSPTRSYRGSRAKRSLLAAWKGRRFSMWRSIDAREQRGSRKPSPRYFSSGECPEVSVRSLRLAERKGKIRLSGVEMTEEKIAASIRPCPLRAVRHTRPFGNSTYCHSRGEGSTVSPTGSNGPSFMRKAPARDGFNRSVLLQTIFLTEVTFLITTWD